MKIYWAIMKICVFYTRLLQKMLHSNDQVSFLATMWGSTTDTKFPGSTQNKDFKLDTEKCFINVVSKSFKVWHNDLSLSTHMPVFAQSNISNTQVSLSALGFSQAACKWRICLEHECIFSFHCTGSNTTKMIYLVCKSYFCLRVKHNAPKDMLYLLFGCIFLSPLFHVIRGFGDALGLHSSDTSFPSVAMTRMGLLTKTGADAVQEIHTF